MRAWQVKGRGEPSEVLELVEADAPEPGPGQVRVRVTAAGVGLPDVLMCRGVYPLTPPLPFTPGQEVAGVVTAVGEGAVARRGGAGHGGDRLLPRSRLRSPRSAWPSRPTSRARPRAWATSTPPASGSPTSPPGRGWWSGVGLDAGERLAVLGAAGGSGIAAVQVGRALGARVLAVVSTEAKAEFCRGLGAHEALVVGDEPIAARLRELGGGGVDVVYDPVGGTLGEDALTALARNGRFLAVGFASGSWPTVHAHDLVVANTSFVGVIAGGQTREQLAEIHAGLSAMIADGRLRSAVTATPSFDELPSALERLADRSMVGKMVVVA